MFRTVKKQQSRQILFSQTVFYPSRVFMKIVDNSSIVRYKILFIPACSEGRRRIDKTQHSPPGTFSFKGKEKAYSRVYNGYGVLFATSATTGKQTISVI